MSSIAATPIDLAFLFRPDEGLAKQRMIELALPDGSLVVAERMRATDLLGGAVGWQGRVLGEELSQATLVQRGRCVHGFVQSSGSVFRVACTRDGAHTIAKVVASSPLDDEPLTVDGGGGEVAVVSDDGPPWTIELLAVYTPEAAGASEDIVAEILLFAEVANQSYHNSEIPMTLQVIGTEEVTCSDCPDLDVASQHLRDPTDGHLDVVWSLRADYRADVVAMFIEPGPMCALASLMTNASLDFAPRAYLAIRRSCEFPTVLAHEVGHILGSAHDRTGSPSDFDGAFPFSHGYVSGGRLCPGGWKTMMAASSGYYESCQYIYFWSDPSRTYQGDPLGIPAELPTSADNYRTLHLTAPIVAGFGDVRIPPPPRRPHNRVGP